MKAYALALLSSLIIFGTSCNVEPNPNPPGDIDFCIWDRSISEDLADDIFKNWKDKWDFTTGVPDSFMVDKNSLKNLVGKNCGFRAYYALTIPGDIRSMGLVLCAVNTCRTDLVVEASDKIYFTQITAPNSQNNYKPKKITLDEAKQLTRNWRQYNQVCLESDLLGNKVCNEELDINRPIPARGHIDTALVQVVPLGQTFTGWELFDILEDEYPNATAYVFYNSMFSIKEGRYLKGYRYDLYIKGYVPKGKEGEFYGPVEIIKPDENGYAVDISGGCPFDCDTMDLLQAN